VFLTFNFHNSRSFRPEAVVPLPEGLAKRPLSCRSRSLPPMYPGVAMRALGAKRGVVGRGAKSISCKELGDLVVGELCCGIGGHCLRGCLVSKG